MIENKKVVVYTAIMGDFDKISDPEVLTPNVEYICFTNNSRLTSKRWKIIYLESKFDDYRKMARYIKINPHIFLKKFDISIWVDGNIKIIKDLTPLIFSFIQNNKKIETFKHFERNCIYEEGLICAYLKKSDCNSIYKQLSYCIDKHYPTNNGLAETNVMLREHLNTKIIECMELWWDAVNNRCLRDQLSFNYSAHALNININYMEGNARFDINYFKCKEHKAKGLRGLLTLLKNFYFKMKMKLKNRGGVSKSMLVNSVNREIENK